MILFRSQVVLGFALVLGGLLFDFLFVQIRMSGAFKSDPVPYLGSFAKQLYDLTKFYSVTLGLLHVVTALVISRFQSALALDWAIFGSMAAGSMLVIVTGFWYASAGPSFQWELRCTVLTVGLSALIVGVGLVVYRVVTGKV